MKTQHDQTENNQSENTEATEKIPLLRVLKHNQRLVFCMTLNILNIVAYLLALAKLGLSVAENT